MKYRKDVDGLRAIAVISVILFHCNIVWFRGGFVGVDVFFVISGYLITSLVATEVRAGHFSFIKFYKRRASRLLPALFICLFITLTFGFIFYDNSQFDILGKQIVFSALGFANILFAQGIDYFANDIAYQPVIHLWSLGVEEQFYLVWPIILLILSRIIPKYSIHLCFLLALLSLAFSEYATSIDQSKAYFYPQYRAFELLIGALVALFFLQNQSNRITESIRLNHALSLLGVFLVVSPMFILDKSSPFPGINALWPCLGTALLIVCDERAVVNRLISNKLFVSIGLISYPLYLYHQPFISFVYYFNWELATYQLLVLVLVVCIPISWLTYIYVEKPIRRVFKEKGARAKTTLFALVSTIPALVILGLVVAKGQGLPWRFAVLNEFAYALSKNNTSPFHDEFPRGYNVDDSSEKSVLFVGDSVLQNYVLPISNAMFTNKYVDTISRGGCVLLKGVDFEDAFSDISCDDLRSKLYDNKKKYSAVVISQSWELYDKEIKNVVYDGKDNYSLRKWESFIEQTIEHFSQVTDEIIIIGGHPLVEGTLSLQPSIFSSPSSYRSSLNELNVSNHEHLVESKKFFEKWNSPHVTVINPIDLWCSGDCHLHNLEWAYFKDSQHVSNAGSEFIENRIERLFSVL